MNLSVETICPFCGTTYFVDVDEKDYVNWINGGMVQDCFPYLSANDRERLISGICPDCWDNMLGGEE